MEEWSDELYFEAKHYWTKKLNSLAPRDESSEEYDAFINALDDKIAYMLEDM